MKQYTFTFNGTDEQLLAGAVENGYTGYKPVVMPDQLFTTEIIDGMPTPAPVEIPEPEVETVDEFICKILKEKSPNDFIRTATIGLQSKKGSENYDAQAMANAMLNLITIQPVE